MRIVCNTNVLVRAVLTPEGSASTLLQHVVEGHVLVTSTFQLTELLEVLRRPRLCALHGRDEAGLRRVISRLYKLSSVVALPADIPLVVVDDPEDNPIVMTAVVGRANILCTLDHHLFGAEVVAYCADRGVRVVQDNVLLAELRRG